MGAADNVVVAVVGPEPADEVVVFVVEPALVVLGSSGPN